MWTSGKQGRRLVLRNVVTVVLLVVPGTAMVGCTTGRRVVHGCTLVGCVEGLDVQLGPDARSVARVSVCVNDNCETPQIQRVFGDPDTDFVYGQIPASQRHQGATVRVAIELFDRRGRMIGRDENTLNVVALEPNGPGCGICYQVRASLDGHGKLRPR